MQRIEFPKLEFPKNVVTIPELKMRGGYDFEALEQSLHDSVTAKPNELESIFFYYQIDLSPHDKKWLLGYQNLIDEVIEKTCLTGIFILRCLYQHPSYINRLHIPFNRPGLQEFYDYVGLYGVLNLATRSLLLGYSPNYDLVKRGAKTLPHQMNVLLQLLIMESREFGEFALVSMLCRTKSACISAERDSIGLDMVVGRMNLSNDAQKLLDKYYGKH